MQTFKEYLIEGEQYNNVVIEPNTGRGRGVAVYGYSKGNGKVERTFLNDFNSIADAKIEYPNASVTASEEEEAKVPANRDRDMEFQGTMNRLNKSTQQDDMASTPNNKRLKQRYGRYNKKTWGGR